MSRMAQAERWDARICRALELIAKGGSPIQIAEDLGFLSGEAMADGILDYQRRQRRAELRARRDDK